MFTGLLSLSDSLYLVNLQPVLGPRQFLGNIETSKQTSVVSPCWLLIPAEPCDQFSTWPQARIHTAGELLTQRLSSGSLQHGN